MNKHLKRHFFHLVDISPWPIVGGFSAFILCNGTVLYFHNIENGGYYILLGFLLVVLTGIVWWRDIIREGTFEGRHTQKVQLNLRYGMILFIVSEIMFFFAFFWAYFHSSLAPTIELGSIWPPEAISPFNPWDVPFINTLILLLSGVTITWAHHAIISGLKGEAIVGLIGTIILAIIFTACQAYEYQEASFNISDGIYGSTFYLATGFHGIHVIIGTLFITINLFRVIKNHYTTTHHFGFEAAAWYWHFVDVVWLFLFITIYYWGS